MHLHRLTLSAVGPFAGEHTIDFAALSAGGIFLLEGPTGAGKSTVVDAVVYALYGAVASAATSKDRIRSGFADPTQESVVDLVFETAAGVFRVRRTPEWERPKRRGTGTTKQQATASLWRLTSPDDLDGGEHLSNRLDEVGLEVQSTVGLSREQFVQTIVLPQGEFATFLRAAPEKRREVLQKVFGTEQYDAVQARLVTLRTAARARIEETQGEVVRAIEGFLGATGPWAEDDETPTQLRSLAVGDAESLVTSAGVTVDLPMLLGHVVGRAEADAAAAQEVARSARAACEAAQRAASTAAAHVDAVARRARLLAEQQALGEAADLHADRVARLDAGRRAAAVLGALDGEARAARDVAARVDDLVEAESLVAADAATKDLLGLDDDALLEARDAAQRTAGSLEGAAALVRQREKRLEELGTVSARLATVEAGLLRLEEQSAALPAVGSQLAADLDAARRGASAASAAEQQLAAVRRRLEAARAVLRLRAEQEVAAAVVGARRADATAAVAEVARLRTARIVGIAGELAQGLVDGEPCPVCGGEEHPAPASLSDAHPSAEQVEVAEQVCADAERQLRDAAAAHEALVARVEAAAELADHATVDECETAVDVAAAALAAAAAAQQDVARLDAALEAHTEQERDLTARLTELADERTALRERARSLAARLEEDDAVLEAARGDFDTVSDRLDHLAARILAAVTLVTARAARNDAEGHAAQRQADLREVLATQGFADADAARESVLPPRDLTALESDVAAHRAASDRVASALLEEGLVDALASLPDGLDPDDPATPALLDERVAAARAALEAAEDHRTTLDAATGLARQRAEAGAERRRVVDSLLDAHATAREQAAAVVRMADLAAGAGPDNPRRLTLGTYVLLRRFEQVVAVANERLDAMSDGRYALERTDEREHGGGLKQGLALRVHDATIDAARDPRTLSGGETFYVSLALALALAQVVTAEAGGVDLGTLFVDEGFGTLDADVLELVLRQLGSLHEEGRVVGIISHVDALKTAIAERIEVRRTPRGPSTLRVLA